MLEVRRFLANVGFCKQPSPELHAMASRLKTVMRDPVVQEQLTRLFRMAGADSDHFLVLRDVLRSPLPEGACGYPQILVSSPRVGSPVFGRQDGYEQGAIYRPAWGFEESLAAIDPERVRSKIAQLLQQAQSSGTARSMFWLPGSDV